MTRKKILKMAFVAILIMGEPLCLSAAVAGNSAMEAQQHSRVRGVISNSEGPLAGAAVVVKGSSGRGTVSGLDGRFSLSGLQKGAVLTISYAGHNTHEIVYDGQETIIVKLLKDGSDSGIAAVASIGTEKKLTVGKIISIDGSSMSKGDAPLYIIDGKPYDGDIKSIDPAKIESITVLKDGNEAVSLYGSKALNGVVEITMKAEKQELEGLFTIVGGSKSKDSSPLCIIDGKPYDGDIKNIDPAKIESITVLKDGNEAVSLYGSKAVNGVIEIKMKEEKQDKE